MNVVSSDVSICSDILYVSIPSEILEAPGSEGWNWRLKTWDEGQAQLIYRRLPEVRGILV